MSYWYLEFANELSEKSLPDLKKAQKKILDIARQMKLARQLKRFNCPQNGCRNCQPLERILNAEAEYVYTNDYNTDIYVDLPMSKPAVDSVIL